MKRNDQYRETCQNNGLGPCGDLYKDFGDIFEVEFGVWWFRNGTDLFAEPDSSYEFKTVTEPLKEDVFKDKDVLILQVPLDQPLKSLVEMFKIAVVNATSTITNRFAIPDDEVESYRQQGYSDEILLLMFGEVESSRRKAGERLAWSNEARYPVVGRPDMDALKNTLLVYDLWKQAQASGTKMTLWQIAMELDHCKGYYDAQEADDRNTLGVIASRYLKKAKAMIENVGLGRFPDIK